MERIDIEALKMSEDYQWSIVTAQIKVPVRKAYM
jgi:hypothetical protein